MLTLNSPETQAIIMEAAALRARHKYSQTIEFLESKLDRFDNEAKPIVCMQIIYAAKHLNDDAVIRKYVLLVKEHFPDFPSIQDYT